MDKDNSVNTRLRVLLVEDSTADETLLLRELRKGGYEPICERIETAEAMLAALEISEWDIIISDFRLPAFSGPEALILLKKIGIDLPFIIVSGTVGEVNAVEAMKAGAHDYVMKGNLLRLAPAVDRELKEAKERRERRQAERALRESEERFRTMADSAPMLLWLSDIDARFTYVNKPWLDFTGHMLSQDLEDGWLEAVHPQDISECVKIYQKALKDHRPFQFEYRMCRHDGEWRWLLNTGSPRFHHDGTLTGFIGTCIDLTERKNEQIERENMLLENERLLEEKASIAIQQRGFLKDILYSVTEGKLRLCETKNDLPAPLLNGISAIPLSAEKLWQVRKVTEAAALSAGIGEMRTNDIVTAASEAGMNAVVHAGGGNANIYTDPGKVQVWVEDSGRGIDLSHLPRATLERGYTTAGTLGHGFFMMLNFADRIYLLTGSAGTTIVLEQYQKPPEPIWLQTR